MTIIYKPSFEKQLLDIIDFIANDKISAAKNFAAELEKLLASLPHNPLRYRVSYYFKDKNIRDMTFNGYTIVYKVNFDRNLIEVLRIFNKNKP